VPAHFFLSYARADEDGYVAKFFDDLAREVQRLSGRDGDEAGFQDYASMRVGTVWAQELFSALNTAPTFVALCSPSYFTSEFCGREWTLFAARAERYRQQHGQFPKTLVPVIWVPARDVPEPVRRLQLTDPEFGGTYAREGVYHLLRLRKYRQDYLIFLRALAKRLLEVAEPNPTPPLDPGYPVASIESAFHGRQAGPASGAAGWRDFTDALTPEPRPEPVPAAGTPRRVQRGGPKHVNFVIVAGPKRELTEIREDLLHYGADPFEWAPYRPELDQRISVFAQAVAADHDLSSGLARSADVVQVLQRARVDNELVVLLVDAWSAQIEQYQAHMREYDRRNEPATGVMVPWSEQDTEAIDQAVRLYQGLAAAFPLNTIRADELFRVRIGTSAAFRQELIDVLIKAQSRVFRKGDVGRWSGSEAWPPRPMIQFPEREDEG
jgi:FxsC-like protein